MPKRAPVTPEHRRWMAQFGGRIRQLRKEELRVTQQEFANKLGFTTGAWASDIETGVNGLDVYVFSRICQLANYPADWFLDPSWDSHSAATPRTRLDWERLFPDSKERAAAHWAMDTVFRDRSR